jgi:hypothetical protein
MNNEIKYIGKDDLTKRELYLLSLNSSFDIPKVIQLPSEHFACFIAWNSKNNSIQEISDLIETLIKNGAAYFCIWGNDCERVEEICDEIDSLNSPDDSVIMTTSHQNDSIEDALYFFLTLSYPHKYYETTLNSSLAISISNNNYFKIIQDAISNPKLLRDKIEEKEE